MTPTVLLLDQPTLFDMTPFMLEDRQSTTQKRHHQQNSKELLAWLELSLFDSTGQPTEEASIPDELFDAPESVDVFAEEGEDKPSEWTNDGVLQLHSVLVNRSLEALGGRGNAKQKAEILDWMFVPSFLGTITKQGKKVRVYTKDVPLTFDFCCKLEGWNPDVIRDRVLQHLPAELRLHYI